MLKLRNKKNKLDIFPSPYLTNTINAAEVFEQNGNISISTSRGCVYRCIYCNFSAMSGHSMRYHSAERVIAELAKIKEAVGGSHMVEINDDIFTLNRKRVENICKRLIKERLGLSYWIETRGDCVDRELLELLYQAGVREVNFGLESAVPRVLYKIKKVRLTEGKADNFEPEREYIRKTQEGVKIAQKIGINASVSVIFGLPGETLEDAMTTLNFVKKLKVFKYYHNLLKVYRGTQLAADYKKNRPEEFENNLLSFSASADYDLNKVPQLKNSYNILKEKWLREHGREEG
jgi:radical SAM superfamily enzyme YgiQ (UPF0313 family)